MSGAAVWPLETGSSWEQVLTLAVDVPSLSYTTLGLLAWKTLRALASKGVTAYIVSIAQGTAVMVLLSRGVARVLCRAPFMDHVVLLQPTTFK